VRIDVLPGPANVLGETPVWSPVDSRLWWVDIRAREVLSFRPSEATVDRFGMPDLACGVALRGGGGGLLVALDRALYALGRDGHLGGRLVRIEAGPPENRLNDLRCDRSGNLWIGTMWDFGARVTGALYRVAPDLSVACIRSGVRIPNALAFSPDGRTIYFADTGTGWIERSVIDDETGLPGPWRPFAAPDAAPGRPDGATVDAEGHLWNARIGGGCLARFAEDGHLDRIVPLPVSKPTACAFGATDLETLYVTTASQGLSATAREDEPLAGRTLALRADVAGLPEMTFAG